MKKLPYIFGGVMSIGLMIVFLVVIAVLCALFQGGIMGYFDFSYETIGSYFLFFIATYIIGIPVEMIAQALPRVLVIMKSLKKMHGIGYFATLITVEVMGYMFIMSIVDLCMSSITASGLAIFAGCLGMAIIDAWMDYCLPDNWSTDEVMKEFLDIQ